MKATTSKKSAAAKTTRAKRAPLKPLSVAPEVVAAEVKAEKARRAASRRSIKAAAEAKAAATGSAAPIAIEEAHRLQMRADEYAANAVAAAQVDAAALGKSVEEVLADMGLDAAGRPAARAAKEAKYFGPMLVLRQAAKSYVKPENGNPCCGDPLSMLCGKFSRDVVVRALIRALNLESNPYAHLNAGQQSMNLRNKARTALKNGLVTFEAISAELVISRVV